MVWLMSWLVQKLIDLMTGDWIQIQMFCPSHLIYKWNFDSQFGPSPKINLHIVFTYNIIIIIIIYIIWLK